MVKPPYGTLAAINPRMVVISVTNFGQTGPYRHYAATDLALYAMGGWMYNQARRPDGAPSEAPRNRPAAAPVAAGAPEAAEAEGPPPEEDDVPF